MTQDSPIARLARQANDAAKRLHRTTGVPVVVFAIQADGDFRSPAFALAGPTDGELELGLYALLQQLEQQCAPGSASGCPDCMGRWERVSAAVAALAPAFAGGHPTAGSC